MSKILRFEMQVPDPEKVIEFYSNAFGWKFSKFPGPQDYWFIQTGESDEKGIDGGLMKSPDGAARTVNSIEVPSIDDYLAAISANGGTIVVPKMAMPGMGYLAYFTDPSGMILGVSQADPNAR
ncbi:VOC family protein [Paenibacillus sp. 5J-6]|jgi:predicted enzyme related to lactoylglutathione lyase|uniref:VOC family protein n=1 Tax=Paenibacillus silvestris TaxID=2606219 RepID=A0A6L8UZL2_9BACL|nr:VOC family protein [Paenibacillus silvestris]MZQ82751.1 VOC family protein [Paenibacillus silvestris]